jgi:hypothetical protein
MNTQERLDRIESAINRLVRTEQQLESEIIDISESNNPIWESDYDYALDE